MLPLAERIETTAPSTLQPHFFYLKHYCSSSSSDPSFWDLFSLDFIMSELTFAKAFLSTLDSRPIKLRADHVVDPQQVGLQGPVSSSPHTSMPHALQYVFHNEMGLTLLPIVHSSPPPRPAPGDAQESQADTSTRLVQINYHPREICSQSRSRILFAQLSSLHHHGAGSEGCCPTACYRYARKPCGA